jgi:hypothetical protein
LQDRTGLVGPASGRSVLPPQKAARDTAPFRVVCEQRCERVRIASIERLCCRPEPIDHTPKSTACVVVASSTQPLAFASVPD